MFWLLRPFGAEQPKHLSSFFFIQKVFDCKWYHSRRLLSGYLPKRRRDWRESLSGLFPLEAPSKILNSRIDL